MQKNRYIIVIVILTVTLIFIHVTPKAHYVGTDFISRLEIPLSFSGWTARDVSDQIVLDLKDHPDKFSNDAIAYQYSNNKLGSLLFIILDAGNFHHPNVCFTAAGFEIKELEETEFNVMGQNFKVHTLFTKKDNSGSLSFYWIIINKKIAHEWVEQKFKQVYFSLLNKQRVGLMVRMDIPASEHETDKTIAIAHRFIEDLSKVLKSSDRDYIFGLK